MTVAGRYSNHSGQSICYECRRGYFCGHSNKTEVACSPGYHQHQRGQTECQVCQRGQFVPSWGSSAENCTVCPFGTFANREGSSVCNECPVGHECPSKSSDSVPCQPGFFQNQVAQTACKPCTDGTFTLSSAAVTCEETVPGMFSACRNEVPVYCPRGWYVGFRGQRRLLNAEAWSPWSQKCERFAGFKTRATQVAAMNAQSDALRMHRGKVFASAAHEVLHVLTRVPTPSIAVLASFRPGTISHLVFRAPWDGLPWKMRRQSATSVRRGTCARLATLHQLNVVLECAWSLAGADRSGFRCSMLCG